MTDTLLYSAPESLDSTLISPGAASHPSASAAASAVPCAPPSSPASSLRTTVLPQVEWNGAFPQMQSLERERFEELRALGQGGMGEVVLLKDHDIERTVALKRLPETAGADHVMRFVEEIRTVGQLDHPNIVPLHDVGVDPRGRYYFLMKHLQGQTLETIIDKLGAGDPDTQARFTHPVRLQVFLGVLNALAYAHGKGFIHRDLKPANIMVGPFGEVTVMDWGLARRAHTPTSPVRPDSLPEGLSGPPGESASRRTQVGSVLGTPLYMSPEQARGQHDQVDVRSDTYSLAVLFHEFLVLRHYLHDRKTVSEVLAGVQQEEVSLMDHGQGRGGQAPVPSEFLWFLHKGLAKDPAARYQSVDAMIQELRGLMEGRIHVQCPRTLAKRGLYEALGSVETHPRLFMGMATLTASLAGLGLFQLVTALLGR